MMYCEFVAGTGCRDNEHNYKVFKDLEVMYMNSDLSKEEIYEYGKKLVDNSRSEKELELEARIQEEIEDWKREIEKEKSDIEWRQQLLNIYKADGNMEDAKFQRAIIKSCKERIAEYRRKIAGLKWILED